MVLLVELPPVALRADELRVVIGDAVLFDRDRAVLGVDEVVEEEAAAVRACNAVFFVEEFECAGPVDVGELLFKMEFERRGVRPLRAVRAEPGFIFRPLHAGLGVAGYDRLDLSPVFGEEAVDPAVFLHVGVLLVGDPGVFEGGLVPLPPADAVVEDDGVLPVGVEGGASPVRVVDGFDEGVFIFCGFECVFHAGSSPCIIHHYGARRNCMVSVFGG